ncbi:MAG: TonB-dependent receptor [Thermodesulfovibrionales bacterium]|nr:TonB-dependent receptor [Thermodesulfovibrionales bacterium]
MLRVISVLLGLIFLTNISYASDSRQFQLDEIEVSSSLIKEEQSTPNMTLIIPELLLQGIGSTLDSALLRQAGIDVQRIQEVGSALDDEAIKIRGFGSNRIMLTINGRTLNAPGTAGGYFIDWSATPLYNIERIEVIKGVSDPRYGNVLGGVINLVTKQPSTKPQLETQVMAGSFNTKTVSFLHSYKPNRFEYSISGGFSETNGYLYNGNFRIKDLNIYAGYDLPWDAKLKTDLQFISSKKGFIVSNRVSKDYDSTQYNSPKNPKYPASDGEYMFGGMGAYPEPGSWWQKEKVYFNISYEQAFKNSTASIRYWQNYGDREAYNTRASLNRVFHKKFYDDRSYGTDISYNLLLPDHDIKAGIEYKKFKDKGDRNYPDDFRAAFTNENYVYSWTWGMYVMDDINVGKDILLTPGIRFISFDGRPGPSGIAEGIKDISMNGVVPSLKITYLPDKNTTIYGSIARALRMPTIPEYYWHFSSDAGVDTSNLTFKKEDGLMLQAGFKTELPTKTRLEASLYYYRIKDYIHFDLINFVSYNIERANIYGLEIEMSQQLGKGFSIFGNYTFQKSKTKGDPFVSEFLASQDRDFDKIPNLPEHKINLGIQYKGTRKEKIALFMRYVSNQDVIYNNNTLFNTDLRVRKQDAYLCSDLEASYPVTKTVDITLFVRNIFNNTYQERLGYPSAGRNLGAGIRAVF